MGSSGKKKTTMAKLARENRLRERRLNKEAKRDARKQASSNHPDAREVPLEAGVAQPIPDPTLAALEQHDRQVRGDETGPRLGSVSQPPGEPRLQREELDEAR